MSTSSAERAAPRVPPGSAPEPLTGSMTGAERLTLTCASVCSVLVIGFVAAINLAVPELAASGLHPSASQLLWIVDAYVVIFACLVIPAGALGDRFGRKGVLTGGLVVFGAGALLSAVSTGVPLMLVGRVVTGAGAAGVLPNSLGVLIHGVAPRRRPQAIAVWAAMSGIGGVVGNVGGGALLSAGSWRWLFVAAVPIALGCALWVAIAAPRSERHDRPLAPLAALLLTAATLALLLGIVEGPDRGWGSATVLGAFAAAVVLFAGWVANGLLSAHPLLDPRLFAIPPLRAACLGMLVVFFGLFGFFYLNASLLQYGRGFSVLRAGLAVIPLTVPMLVGTRLVPRLVARVGQRAVLAAAFAVTGVALFGLASAVRDDYVVYAAWMVVTGVGITLALPTLTIAISSALPREQAGVGGGLQSTTREFGSALGVAVIGTLLTAHFVRALHAAPAFAHRTPHTVAGALRVAGTNPAPVLDAYTGGAADALRIAAVVVLVAGALVTGELAWASRGRTAPAPA